MHIKAVLLGKFCHKTVSYIQRRIVQCISAVLHRQGYLHSSNDAPPQAACGKQGDATK